MAQPNAELELKIKELTMTNDDLKSTNDDLESTNEDLNSTIKDLKSTMEDLEREMDRLERERITNDRKEQSNYASLSEKVNQLETELCMMEQDRDSAADLAREKLTEYERICANLQKEYDYLDNRDNFKLRQEIDEKTFTIEKLQSQIVDYQSQIGTIHANIEAVDAEHTSKRVSAEAAFAELTAAYNTLKVDYNLHRDKVIKEPEGGALLWNAFRTSQKGKGLSMPQLQACYRAQWPEGKGPHKKTNSTKIV